MAISDSIKNLFNPKEIETQKKCPICENDSLVPWVIRLHEGNQITENPENIVVGLRCEKCIYTVVHNPMAVFWVYTNTKKNEENNPNLDEIYSDMLTKAIERCVIDHRKDCIPQDAWNVVTPRIKKKLAKIRAEEYVTSPCNTLEYWESVLREVICYEAYGKCVWGFD